MRDALVEISLQNVCTLDPELDEALRSSSLGTMTRDHRLKLKKTNLGNWLD